MPSVEISKMISSGRKIQDFISLRQFTPTEISDLGSLKDTSATTSCSQNPCQSPVRYSFPPVIPSISENGPQPHIGYRNWISNSRKHCCPFLQNGLLL